MSFVQGYCVGPKLGIDFTAIDTVAKHQIGKIAYDHRGRKMVYVKANGTIGAFRFVKAPATSDPFTNVVIGTASAAATLVLGMTPRALVAGNYAWIVQSGVIEDDAIVVSANLANGQPIVCDANGAADIAAATDIENALGICVVDDTDNTGTILLF